jgi:hypothetical protein
MFFFFGKGIENRESGNRFLYVTAVKGAEYVTDRMYTEVTGDTVLNVHVQTG